MWSTSVGVPARRVSILFLFWLSVSAFKAGAGTATADLGITLTDGVTMVTPGSSVIYTISVSNYGPDEAASSKASVIFPSSLTCNWICGRGGGGCTSGGTGDIADTINLGEGTSVTYVAKCKISVAASEDVFVGASIEPSTFAVDPDGRNNRVTDRNATRPLLPPIGHKIQTSDTLANIDWRVVWINSRNSSPVSTLVTDVIPAGTTYAPESLVCSARGSSTTTSCSYDSTRNRIAWQGAIDADLGAANEDAATNEVAITFRTTVGSEIQEVTNQASALADSNGNGNFADEDTSYVVMTNRAVWIQGGVGIPAVSAAGLATLALLLAGAGWWLMRRHAAVAKA
jgi:uncharacterized repeat protein (TIGR01451 family)